LARGAIKLHRYILGRALARLQNSKSNPALKRILVIEGETSTRNNLLILLKSEGFDAFGASDAASGISAARKHPPDLVVCDLMMPEMNGHSVRAALLEDAATAEIPMVFLIHKSDDQSTFDAFDAGDLDCLTKPFTSEDVLEALRRKLAEAAPLADKLVPLPPVAVDEPRAVADGVLRTPPDESKLDGFFLRMSTMPDGLMVLGVSVDHFGDIVAGLSHSSLEALLDQLYHRLEETANAHGGTAVRAMGEVFIMIVSGDSSAAGEVSKEVLRRIRQPFFVADSRLHLSASVGVAAHPEHSNDLEQLIALAQGAISYARASGGDTWHLYNPAIELLPHNKLDLSSSLFGAVEAGELFLVYQPQVSLQNGAVTGMEALIRWNRGDAGVVSPAVFIPLAEENGAILEIGDWVVRTAALQAKSWLDAGLPPIKMSVNISPRQLRSDGFAERMQLLIHETGLPAGYLGFEVTESALMHNFDLCKRVLQDLRDTGAGVAMDDFGTGYCGLGYLGKLPFDTLKIDRSFVSGLPDAPDKVAIVPALIQMARGLGLQTIAEGVETVDELRFLHSIGCEQMQGYLFSRPLSPAECTALLENRVAMNLDTLLSAEL